MAQAKRKFMNFIIFPYNHLSTINVSVKSFTEEFVGIYISMPVPPLPFEDLGHFGFLAPKNTVPLYKDYILGKSYIILP